ncbi:MAG: nucleoside hydrolase [Chloroflexi bacterium]|nr:nucleoside hydrolase [Chloroflexota bacterium]
MRLIIDTDAGVDDAQALMLALAYPGARIEAITTVTGNVHVDKVIHNVFTVLDVMGVRVPVYRGADHPLVPGFWEPEERVHGADGLGGYRGDRRSNGHVQSAPAALALLQQVNDAPGEITVVALGPLTNLALACRLDPSFPQKVKALVFMGGTISALGNTRNLTAEFNAFCDPEAVRIVLDAFPESTMLSWETTLKHSFSWEQYDSLSQLGTDLASFFGAITGPTIAFLRQFPQVPGYLLPDPLAMAIALDPGLITASEHLFVTMELQGALTRGQTVIDYMGTSGCDPNVHVVTGVDTRGVYEQFYRVLS